MPKAVTSAILSFTEIDPDKHRQFNEWHRYDHQPEQYIVEGVVAATRLVATPDLMAYRYIADVELGVTQYFGYYLVSEPREDALRELGDLVPVLKAKGRWFERRGPSAGYRTVHKRASPFILNPPEVLPFRPHQGVFVTVHDPNPGASLDQLSNGFQAHENETVRTNLALAGVAGCWSFEHDASHSVPGSPYAAPMGRVIRVYWLRADPADLIGKLRSDADPIDANQSYRRVFSSAYRVIDPASHFSWFDAVAS